MPTPPEWETIVAYAVLFVALSCVVAVLVARAFPPSSRDPKLRDLRERHVNSNTISQVQDHGA